MKRMGKPTYVMDISKDGEIFHINLETTDDILGHGKREKSMKLLEAKAESDTVLSMRGGLVTMRLEGDVIYYDYITYTRAK
ncbi:hypothetical protein ALQ60_02394 [Pseudomonas syringae pv. papulans]|nr:hypothetical protein ALQ60_02394 [Pseudomonas syringae pv. papulans]RMV44557.1 hypothetical protein ALP11_200099 [Pseudomonas syringae pv. papulans]